MRSLVTGGAGFIGSTLVDRLLAEGHEVDVVDDLSTGTLANLAAARASAGRALTIHHLDIRAPELVELMGRRSPEVVFHLAAQTGSRGSDVRGSDVRGSDVPGSNVQSADVQGADVQGAGAQPVVDAEVNIVGSLQVLEGARAAHSERVVFAADGRTLYGETDDADLPLLESAPQRPRSPHGVSKKAVLDYLSTYRALHALEFCALALANVYGPRQGLHGEAGVVAVFADRLRCGEPVTIFGDGEQTRDFVYVDDVVDAFVRAASRGGGLVCNVGTARETSINHLYQVMASAAGSTVPPVRVSARPGESRRHCLDVARAGMQLGWRPWTSLEDGVRATLDQAGSAG